jgi:hypothetical protein
LIQREQSSYAIEGDLDGRVIDMSIDPGAMAHIMNTLTRLYSDPEYAVIREYATNARDAHIEAGNTSDPIRVYTPTPLSPFFRVVDQGIGLSPDDIFAIYSRYGASTKRNTNEQTGMLGFGCKSALAYASQFTLTGVKDGVRAQVSISRDGAGAGQMTVVDTSTTDAPNGVEIMVPVRASNEFDRKAKQFFRFWEPGTVLLNDKEPERVEGLKLAEGLHIVEGDGYRNPQDTIVMGNVPYPVKSRLSTGLAYTHAIVANVKIGDVDFTPSREELEYTDITNATIGRISQEFETAAAGAIQRFVDKAKTHAEALATVAEWSRVLPRASQANTYRYRGQDIPTEHKAPDMFVVPLRSHVESRNVLAHYGHPASSWHKTTWVYGYPMEKKWTAPKGRKLRKYAEDNGIATEHFAVLADRPVSDWIDPATCVPWEEIAKVKLDRVPSARTGRLPGSYPAYVDGSYEPSLLATDIDQSKPLYYVEGGRYAGTEYLALLERKHRNGCTLVQLTANRVDKFKRDFPKAKQAWSALQDMYNAWKKKSLTPEQETALAIWDSGRYYYGDEAGPAWKQLRKLDAAKVKDPDIKAAIKATETDLTSIREQRRMFSDIGLGERITASTWKNPLDAYPLFDMNHLDHTYMYLNAVYAANQRGA